MVDEIERIRLRSQQRIDQLVAMLDDKDERAIKEARRILMKIVVDGNPVLLADVLRGMAGRLDVMQEAIEERHKRNSQKNGD